MNIRELLYLCMMAYADLPPLYAGMIARGGRVPVAAFADNLLRMDAAGLLECISLNGDRRIAAGTMLSSEGVITDYINENSGSGFVGYVVEYDEVTVAVMRGSESPGICAESYVDWVDNLCEPFTGSVQQAAVMDIAAKLSSGKVIFTGHSKGGHNALAALAVSENPEASAVVFNGQGFAADALTVEEKRKLAESGVNYVTAGDVVGALLEHPEKRIYVKQKYGVNPHMPEAYVFDEKGAPVHDLRSIKSYAIEAASRFAERRLGESAKDKFRRACRFSLGLK